MDIKREWRKSAPTHDVSTLGGLVYDFKERFPRNRRDTVLVFAGEQETLAKAIEVACRSLTPEGKMHNHQSKVPILARAEFSRELKKRTRKIRDIDDFDTLWGMLDDIGAPIHGLGPVTIYDVATRVGAFLRLEPTSVYLHAGVRQGALALGLIAKRDKRAYLKREELPEAFMVLTADEVEDFICTYRTVFKKEMLDGQ